MSGAGENRSSWQRPQGRGNRAPANNPNKDGARQQSMPAVSGNVWKSKGSPAAERTPAQASGAPSAPAEHHVPVKDFNANEVKDFLKKKYLENAAGHPTHKVQGDSVAKRSSGAWGSRSTIPHLMPNGQDFFTQLRKQLAALDQSKPS